MHRIGTSTGVAAALSVSCLCLELGLGPWLSASFVWAEDLSISSPSIFGQALSEQTLNYPDLQTVRFVGDKLVIVVQEGDAESQDVGIIVLDPITMRELWHWKGPYRFYNYSMGRRPGMVIGQFPAEDDVRVSAGDLDSGLLLTDLRLRSVLLPSPNAMYFFTVCNLVSISGLEVYDRSGRVLLKQPLGAASCFVGALDDSIIGTSTSNGVDLIDVHDGEIVKSITIPRGEAFVFFIPVVRTSANGGLLVVAGQDRFVAINEDMALAVDKRFQLPIADVGAADDNRFVAVLGCKSGKFVFSLYEVYSGAELWNVAFESAARCGQILEDLSILFAADLITLNVPSQISVPPAPGEKQSFETYVFRYDRGTGQLRSQTRFEGLLQCAVSPTGDLITVRANPLTSGEVHVQEWRRE